MSYVWLLRGVLDNRGLEGFLVGLPGGVHMGLVETALASSKLNARAAAAASVAAILEGVGLLLPMLGF